MSDDLHEVDLARKRMAVLGNVVILGVLCPFLSIMVVGEMIGDTHRAKYDEATLDAAPHH